MDDDASLWLEYIKTTPVKFPKFVTPQARDLLRRMLEPTPTKRADIVEVACHSWLSEYQHVVSDVLAPKKFLSSLIASRTLE